MILDLRFSSQLTKQKMLDQLRLFKPISEQLVALLAIMKRLLLAINVPNVSLSCLQFFA
jgi:hypothetical protein